MRDSLPQRRAGERRHREASGPRLAHVCGLRLQLGQTRRRSWRLQRRSWVPQTTPRWQCCAACCANHLPSRPAADLKRRLGRNDDDVPRSLPAAERAVRLLRVSNSITGFKVQNEHEPSHSLVDALPQQLDDGTMRYITWDSCAARSHKIADVKKDNKIKMITPDQNGFLE